MINTDDPRIQEIINSADSKAVAIDQLLELGLTKKQILNLGYVESTVRKEMNKFKEEGRGIPGGSPDTSALVLSPYSPVILRGTEHISPAWMAQRLAYVVDGNEKMRAFIEFLLMYPLYQEDLMSQVFKRNLAAVTALKGDQTKDLIEAMQLGQQHVTEAAHEAAIETATIMAQSNRDSAIIGAKNPMAAMMSQSMMPMMTNMMQRLMGFLTPMAPGQPQPLPDQQPQQATNATGWTRRSEESKKEKTEEGD